MVINFGAGPAKLPEAVMQKAQRDLNNFDGLGISVVEVSHRSSQYTKLNETTEQNIRDLVKIPDNYKVLFMHGGGVGQFDAVPLNLMSRTGTADYVVTGSWSARAAKEAAKYGKVNMVVPKTTAYTDVPRQESWKLDPNASYVYYCANETVDGVEFDFVPDTKSVPLVADMSSNFLSRPVDISKFGLIFVTAQKNIGPSGVTLVIIREDLLGSPLPICPVILNYSIVAKDKSVHNTPATFAVYLMNLVFEWVKEQGGVIQMEKLAVEKSSTLYETLEKSNGFYCCPVASRVRSRMNVPFRIRGGDDALEGEFLKEAQTRKMLQLKGHRSVGGIRASIYNAITVEEVKTLVDFMKDFMKRHA